MSFLSKLLKNVDITINLGDVPPAPPAPKMPPPPLTLAQRVERTIALPAGFERDSRLQQHVTTALNQKDFGLAYRAASAQSGWMRDMDLTRVTDAALVAGDVATAGKAARAIGVEYTRNDQLLRVAEAALKRGDLAQANGLVNAAGQNPYARPAGMDRVQGQLGDAFLARGQLGQAITVAKGMWDIGKQTELLSRVTATALSRRQFGVAQAAIREVRDYSQQRKLQRSYDQAVLPPPPPPHQPNVTIDLGSNVTITFN